MAVLNNTLVPHVGQHSASLRKYKSKAPALHIRYIVLLSFHFCCFLFLNGWGLAVIYNVAIYDAELMEFVRMPLN